MITNSQIDSLKFISCTRCGCSFKRGHPKQITCSKACRDNPIMTNESLMQITSAIHDVFGIDPIKLVGNGREWPVCEARFCLYGMLHLSGETRYTIETLTRKTDSTIRAGLIQFRNLMDSYPSYVAKVNRVKDLINV